MFHKSIHLYLIWQTQFIRPLGGTESSGRIKVPFRKLIHYGSAHGKRPCPYHLTVLFPLLKEWIALCVQRNINLNSIYNTTIHLNVKFFLEFIFQSALSVMTYKMLVYTHNALWKIDLDQNFTHFEFFVQSS